jgi:aminoglycoside/choline kinase family phosphotransferase
MRVARIEPASSDASFRRYFRVYSNDQTYVVMDAPPGKEDVRPYVRVAGMLEALGVHVPHIHEQDEARGMLLLEDLGTTLYLQRLLAGDDSERLYGDALDALAAIQVQGHAACAQLPPYGRSELARELALMPEWFLAGHLALTLGDAEQRMVEETFEFLITEALGQPRVFVHRDYHARNLMVVASHNPGIIDFQDALAGPVGYDLVSLLKDCYIAWPRERVIGWVHGFRARLLRAGGQIGRNEEEFTSRCSEFSAACGTAMARAATWTTCRARSITCAMSARATPSSRRWRVSSQSAWCPSCRTPMSG